MASVDIESKYIHGQDSGECSVTVNVVQPLRIILAFNKNYLTSLGCILHCIQLILSVIGVVCIASSSSVDIDILHLPLSWHVRAYIFGSVFAILVNAAVLVINISSLIDAFQLNWPLFELIVYGVLSALYLCCSSMLASAVRYYRNQNHHHISQQSTNLLITAVILGFICFLLYGFSSVLSYRGLRRPQQQFAAHRLPPARQQSDTSESRDFSNLQLQQT